jgi:hypothetical protein
MKFLLNIKHNEKMKNAQWKKVLFILSFLCFILILSAQKTTIVLQEDFESPTFHDMLKHWNDSENTSGMSFSTDVPAGSHGKQSLMMTYTSGLNGGGYLYKSFPEGYDTLYARFYVKFITNYSKVHHFVKMGGTNPASPWPIGKAGIKPSGDDRFITGIEPIGDNWTWDFYTYWMHMRGYADPNHFWGNTFNPSPSAKIEIGKWICVEIMMIMNNPVDSSNGEQAFWINGKKIVHLGKGFPNGYWKWDKFISAPDSLPFEGFQWRNNDKLKLNFFWLSYYMTDGKPGEIDKILFDDVVVSKRYIGPLVP